MFAAKSCIILAVFGLVTKIQTEDIRDVIQSVPEDGKLEVGQF